MPKEGTSSAGMQVGVNLGKAGYLEKIAEATADIDVQILFCNAGYMLTGFFENTCAEQSFNYSKSLMHAIYLSHVSNILLMHRSSVSRDGMVQALGAANGQLGVQCSLCCCNNSSLPC